MRKAKQAGFTLVELLICIAIIIIIGAMVVPYVKDAVRSANETSALQSIQTLHTSQTQFFALHQRYARSFKELEAVKLNPALADGKHSGYLFSLDANDTGYALFAKPEKATPGAATYFSDESLVTRFSRTAEPAGPSSPIIE